MKASKQIRSITYLKSHAAEIVRELEELGGPLLITQNGEARVVLQDVKSYEQTQDTLSLLKILALGQRQIDEGKIRPLSEVISIIRNTPR